MASISSLDNPFWAQLPPELDDDAADGAPSALDHDFIKLRDDFNKKSAQKDTYFDWDLDQEITVLR